MFRPSRWSVAALGGAACGAVVLAGCGSSGGSASGGGGAQSVVVTITDAGCEPSVKAVDAGPVTFRIENAGADAISEAELLSGDRIVGEKENLAPGLSGSFSLNLAPGTYTLYCPGGKGAEKVPFTVNPGSSPAPSAAATGNAALLQRGADQYRAYVQQQVAELVIATKAFDDAIRAGDVAAAKRAYAPARAYYERIEPVAESFGDLDPAIDAREGDVDDPATWTGFHRLEKALWVTGSLAGMTPIADGLDANVEKLRTLVQTVRFQPAEIGNGATSLLEEVAKSKITGEEENYSHVDLVDFVANVDGAEQAFAVLEPALKAIDPTLQAQVRSRFDALTAALDAYRTGSTATDYRNYTQVTPDQRKALSTLVNALAEPLSKVAGTVVGT